jgi:hypothetical protein
MTSNETEAQKTVWMNGMMEQIEKGHRLQNNGLYHLINAILIIAMITLFAYGVSLLSYITTTTV